ncbi:MAG TPA: GNAT family N-acetyltransferase [Myxococcales bacterium]|jgi:ribosomal protein S18 acetylase RimI-like enzyme|nr:GNAT family N-acetyltransferase [Myxococcales bacterium]
MISLRLAVPGDALAVARIHVRAWQTAYRGLLPDSYLDSLRAEDRAARYTFDDTAPGKPATLLAVEGETVCGFATTGPSRSLEGAGELMALHVDPEHWRRGIGRQLIAAARKRLVEQGYETAMLMLLEGNERADGFYRDDLWAPDGHKETGEIWGAVVNELRYRRPLK